MKIGFIAHDAKKALMQNFCIAYRGILARHSLYATGTTGRMIEEACGLNVYKYLAGHVGGVQQMITQIEQNDLDLLIFLCDPLTTKKHEPNIKHMMFVCDMHTIPLATNLATAELIVLAIDRGDLDWREMYR